MNAAKTLSCMGHRRLNKVRLKSFPYNSNRGIGVSVLQEPHGVLRRHEMQARLLSNE